MEVIFLILFFLLGGLREAEAISVTGELGKTITIKCSHSNAFTNVKYFCKGACTRHEDILISSRDKKLYTSGRYTISDEGNTFFVTISALTGEDSGTYWCGIERVGLDTYNQVVLTVTQEEDPDNGWLGGLSNLSSRKLVYIGVGLGVVVLALAVVFLIFLRHRRRNIRASSEKVQDTVYATPHCQKQNAHHVPASSSKDEESQGRADFSMMSVQRRDTSRDDAGNVYSNITVSSESQVKPHGLLYSTVSFNKHPDCSAAKPCETAVTYCTLKDISTDESTVCSSF